MSQAVRIGNRLETSGQAGYSGAWVYPEKLSDEIANTFDNIERLLTTAGMSWRDVVQIMSYHVPTATDRIGEEHLGPMVEQMRKRMPDHRPIWTCVGVPVLGEPEMRVEIRVTAVAE